MPHAEAEPLNLAYPGLASTLFQRRRPRCRFLRMVITIQIVSSPVKRERAISSTPFMRTKASSVTNTGSEDLFQLVGLAPGLTSA